MSSGLIGAGLLSGLGAGLSRGISDSVQLNLAQMRESGENDRLDRRMAAEEKRMAADEARHKEDLSAQTERHKESMMQAQTLADRSMHMAELASGVAVAKEQAAMQRDEFRFNLQNDTANRALDEKAQDRQVKADDLALRREQHQASTDALLAIRQERAKGAETLPVGVKETGRLLEKQMEPNNAVLKNTLSTPEERAAAMKDNARIVRDASDLYGQGEKMDAITKKNAPSLTVLSPEKQALFVSKYGDKLKNDPGAQDRASKALMAEGIDPSFLSGATAQRQPDLSLPTGADSQVDATNERKRMRSAPPSTSGGLVTVPAPSASEQQAMASALPPTTFESASPEGSAAGAPPSGPPATDTTSGGMIGSPAPSQVLTPKDLTTLLTKEQKLSIAGLVKKIRSPGVSERPATRADLQDYLLKTLGPLYAQNNQPIKTLVSDIDELMGTLLPMQNDMSGNGYTYDAPRQ